MLGLAVISAIGVSSLMASAQSAPANGQAPAAQEQQMGGQNGAPNDSQRPPRSNSIKRTVTNIDNGVIVTCTSDNADEVKMIQSHNPPTPPADSKVTVVKENLSNGIKVTITSTDSETVKNIQAHEAQGGGPRGMKGGENGQGQQLKDVKRTVTNTSDGVTVHFSSTDASTIKLLQDREARGAPDAQGQGMGRGMGQGQRDGMGRGQFGQGGRQGAPAQSSSNVQ